MTESYRKQFPATDKVSDAVTFDRLQYWFGGRLEEVRAIDDVEVFCNIYLKRAEVCKDMRLVDMLNLMRTVEQSEIGSPAARETLAVYLEGRIDQFCSMDEPFDVTQKA